MKTITWSNNRANIAKNMIERARRFETAWILEVIPYLQREGWRLKGLDKISLKGKTFPLRDVAAMLMASNISDMSAVSEELKPYHAYTNVRLKTITTQMLNAKP